ncbi:Putative proline-rich protein PRCC [Septoria linicola]|uniref:Proline-rich protein PRCC n=1 Tax=Septoria linicola TaxID=215465 RepID=A0A9Q9EJN7_9PEZI|nr:putative proline-rich protein PRCC [Septoria linicola]USW52382.1 Putative proline-rich protein PRCC [Septoria linicola]
MGLVEYSDSESEGEEVPAPAPKVTAKPATFSKAAPGKLQVSLPSLKPEPGRNGNTADSDGPPAKRARTGGAFSAFNALLPAPKKATATTSSSLLKKGVSLKTSSEAAFTRNPLPQRTDDDETYRAPDLNGVTESKKDDPPPEPKMVAKATRFLPLSVSSKKKKKPLPKIPAPETAKPIANPSDLNASHSMTAAEPPKPKAKKSLFSVTQEDHAPEPASTGDYEPITIERSQVQQQISQPIYPSQPSAPANPNSLEAVAADMNLTPAQRRQLFGRKGGDVSVQHFDLDAQYAENERARAAGQVVEHRAVKAVAPGKHSLQQLVNNSQTQQDALQDKWAEGKRARGEGGSKYGWST